MQLVSHLVLQPASAASPEVREHLLGLRNAALELASVLPSTWRLDVHGFAFCDAMQLQGTPATATVVLSAIAKILMAGLQSERVGRASREAHHALVLQSQKLRQLLPS